MNDYRTEDEDDLNEEEEQGNHFFCKLTFGQFFTMMVLELITLCFVFYLGARYGNDYLRLDLISETPAEKSITIVAEGSNSEPEFTEQREKSLTDMSDDELREMARKTLKGDKVDLKQKVNDILARQQGPSTPPMGEPPVEEMDAPYATPELGTAPTEQAQQMPVTYEPKPVDTAEADQGVVKVKSGGDSKFSVQVGSYPDVKEASYRVEEWKSKGYPAYMMIVDLAEKGQWYRVRIGAFANKDEAGSYLNDLVNKEEINDAFVVKNEQ